MMEKLKKGISLCVVLCMVFGAASAWAAVRTGCSLEGRKVVDSAFVDSVGGTRARLTQSCASDSEYGTMAVVRGKTKYDAGTAVWLMYPAQKCAKGRTKSTVYNILDYARSHYGATYANLFSVRMYGNHCDNQKERCYGTALATNIN